MVDKGTLDCALVEGTTAALLCAVDRLLPAGGVYAVLSFREVCGLTLTTATHCHGPSYGLLNLPHLLASPTCFTLWPP